MVVKRVIDVVLSALLLLLLSPVLLLAAAAVRLTSPGSVLFRQIRMGRGFKPFEILKLRTMAQDIAGPAFTLGPDRRITWVGKWLRLSKIDELPQLWNVLRGDMSLVGPRPVLPELTVEFRVHYGLLLRGKPGLTDPASLKYCRETKLLGAAKDPMTFFKTVVTPDKIRISLEYMERATVWTDCEVIAMTALICCFPFLSWLYGPVHEPHGMMPHVSAGRKPGDGFQPWSPVIRRDAEAVSESMRTAQLLQQAESVEISSASRSQPWMRLPTVVLKTRNTASRTTGDRIHL